MQTALLPYVILGVFLLFPSTTTAASSPSLTSSDCAALQGHGLRPYNAFASPAYPGDYPPNQDCIRVIQARPGYHIRITFNDFFQIETSYTIGKDVHQVTSECPNDFVEFRDGRYGFSPLIGRFCGMHIPAEDVVAKSGFLWVRFRSDEQLEYRGFLATIDMERSFDRYHQPPYDCHLEQTHGLDGHISTQKLNTFLPVNSSAPLDCVWQLAVPSNYSVVLFVREFHLHSPNHCSNNFVEVYSGGTSDQPLRRFCGLTASTVFSSHHLMYVRVFVANARWLPSIHFEAMYSTYSRLKNCSSRGLFSCGDENCVPSGLRCNGRMNCPYGMDEMYCHVAQDTLLRIATSSYMPLLLLIVIVFVVVVALIVWSCRSKTFCRQRRTSYSEYLRDVVREPPPGVSRAATHNGNGHVRK